jgi:hypothetical protein
VRGATLTIPHSKERSNLVTKPGCGTRTADLAFLLAEEGPAYEMDLARFGVPLAPVQGEGPVPVCQQFGRRLLATGFSDSYSPTRAGVPRSRSLRRGPLGWGRMPNVPPGAL